MIRGTIWLWFYQFLILFPLVVGAVFVPPGAGRGFVLNCAVACGYVGLAVMAFEFALVSRLHYATGAFGLDALQLFHKQMGYVSTLFLVAHPTLLMVGGYPWQLLNPVAADIPWAWRWGVLSFYGLLVLIGLSAGRRILRLSYDWWQITHRLIAPAVVLAAIAHTFMVGNFTGTPAMRGLWIVYLMILLGLAVRYRIVMPLRSWRRPWKVVRNVKERGNSQTLVLRPVGHDGFAFEPGQFAWLNLGKTPFHREQHPISFSSSAEVPPGGEIAFTIKALGDWSSRIVPAISPGTRIWLDGPYGVFTPDREQGPGYVLLAGGVGITPLVSMCLTMADREDNRPVVLFYGRRAYDELTFRELLDALPRRMNLKVVYVLEQASEDWRGETGLIRADLLRRYLPRQFRRFQYFVCGPAPMMDDMETLLMSDLSISPDQVHTERFDMV
jgi:predicted ferric reductase